MGVLGLKYKRADKKSPFHSVHENKDPSKYFYFGIQPLKKTKTTTQNLPD